MPIYVYETIPAGTEATPERFEVRQSMSEQPLTQHPQTGAPVRRVLSGGLVTFTNSSAGDACGFPGGGAPSGGCGTGNCCMN
jgi:predicted nucleic acid-binding Zn ribbon protein